MPTLSQQEIRARATAFVHEWTGVARERAEAQSFWNDFFNIFGITRRRVASFEEPVKLLAERRGSIDLFWKGVLLVEHKSRGQNLSRAYAQALDYFPGIAEEELPHYVLVSDFENFRLHDLESGQEHDFHLRDLPGKIHLFSFISGYRKQTYQDEDPVNNHVAERMGQLHDALRASGFAGHVLERFLVRLIYCLFADDTGIFPKDHFHSFIDNRTNPNGSDVGGVLASIFQTLNQAPEQRQATLDEDLQQFPYVDGGLFEETLPIPAFNSDMRVMLLACCKFDWSKVSPAIFGSMFQSVMDAETRRNLGAHYTSEKNILKVVRGLFLDELTAEFNASRRDARRLRALHDHIAGLRFLDPACGCGNFLVITYRELRRLEITILKQLRVLSGKAAHQLALDVRELVSRIDVDSLFGIELEEFPARIAEVAIWLTDHQMNMELSEEFGETYRRLPLRKSANIVNGNALRMDWERLVPKPEERGRTKIYILGNPPFVAKKSRSSEQNEDMEAVFAPWMENHGVLDYVCSWYVKAAEYIRGTSVQAAFVSTNSITQGEQVGVLWRSLLDIPLHINFAHRTFRWTNEARGVAAVFCVIIGFAAFERRRKFLYDYERPESEPMEIEARQINPYLVDGPVVLLPSRTTPLCDAPELQFGNMPNDDGNFLLTDFEKNQLLRTSPQAEKFIRRFLSAKEFIQGEARWCIWLIDAKPEEIRAIPEIRRRVSAVREARLASDRPATRRLADTPYRFGEIRQPKERYILIPRHSSENRNIIPMDLFEPDQIAADSCITMPGATYFHFGVLMSRMHMAWVKQVCGRIKGDYRYSNNIVYNNFPWPKQVTTAQRSRVEQAARDVLAARASFPGSTLADLYDPLAMPRVLVDAHNSVDAAVDSCYRTRVFQSDLERLEFLFELYLEYTQPMVAAAGAIPIPKHERIGRINKHKN
jgi:hypothetical protein